MGKQTVVVSMRVTTQERARIAEAAKRLGITPSNLLRTIVLDLLASQEQAAGGEPQSR